MEKAPLGLVLLGSICLAVPAVPVASAGTVTITAPANGAKVTSPVTVKASANSTTCNGGLNHLQVLVNGTIDYKGSGSCSVTVLVNVPSGADTIAVQAIKWDGSLMAQSSVMITAVSSQAVNGACGAANGADLTSAPATGLCSAGTASTISGTGPWIWSCFGSNGGTTAQCMANLEVNGVCGSANGVSVESAPTTGLCSAGAASSVTGTGPWRWSCAGNNGGTTAQCSAPLLSAVNEQCPPGSAILASGDIQSGINNTPSGGTLCLSGSAYSVASTVTVRNPITITGVGYPQITQTFSGILFDIRANNVTIDWLDLIGGDATTNENDCGAGSTAIQAEAVQNTAVENNIATHFTCGFEFLGANGFTAEANLLSSISYTAIGTYGATNGTIDRNTIVGVDANGSLGDNAYGITATGNTGDISTNITISNNYVNNAHTWECYDTHYGQSISFLNNVCYDPGTVGINAAGIAGAQVSNIKADGNIIDETGLATACQADANNHGCNSIVLTGSGEIENNTIHNYPTGGCKFYAPSATVSGNNCTQGSADITPPSIPTGFSAVALSATRIALSWNASTDNVGVTGYEVFRNGILVGSTSATPFQDTGLAASTSYSYTVRSKDAAGNASGMSLTVSVSTQ